MTDRVPVLGYDVDAFPQVCGVAHADGTFPRILGGSCT